MSIQKNFQYEYDRKADLLKLEQEKKDALTAEREKKQNIILFIVTGGLLLVIMLAIFLFRNYKIGLRKSKIIRKQKEMVEEKQKEIVDSINYAKRIQYALLAHHELLKNNLNSFFVLFKPKDIVSGDFYWAVKKNNAFYLAVCDSTGHGVPGAFMSLLNISFLNEAVIERNLEAPEKILEHVRARLINALSTDEKEGSKDGMDCSLLKFEGNKLSFACANNPIVLIRNNSIQELNYDRMPVGFSPNFQNPFSCNSITLQAGDTIYAFTDGFADQFGGESGKKLKRKPFLSKLLDISSKDSEYQSDNLSVFFENWKNKHEQVDDVLVIGIKY